MYPKETNWGDPKIAAAFYKMQLISSSDLVVVAERLLEAGLYSDSIGALAGETNPIWSEVAVLFEEAMVDLDVDIPSKDKALQLTLMQYLRNIVDENVTPFEGMMRIDNDLYSLVSTDGSRTYANVEGENPTAPLVGAELGIENMFTWYRELQDAEDGSMLLYYSELPREEATIKFNQHLKEEALKRVRRLENEGK